MAHATPFWYNCRKYAHLFGYGHSHVKPAGDVIVRVALSCAAHTMNVRGASWSEAAHSLKRESGATLCIQMQVRVAGVINRLFYI